MLKSRLLWLLLAVFVFMGTAPLNAQEPITISIALPAFYQDTLRTPLESFQENNPDIIVNIIGSDAPAYNPGDDIEEYLDSMAEYARTADVLVGDEQVNPLSTRSGYFLDLAPLVNVDNTLNPNDFFPSMWQSYQWDGATWALPLAGDVIGLLYDPAEFDAAGLRYPDERWTVADLIVAAERLAVYGEGDTVEEAPVANFANIGYVAVAVLDNPLYDPFQLEGFPSFADPALQLGLELWVQLQEDGFLALSDGFELTPLVVAPSVISAVTDFADSDREYQFTTLPGGRVAVQPVGAALSAGTQHPEAAFRLIKFLTEDPNVFANLVGQPLPARRTLFDTDASSTLFNLELPEDVQQTVIDFAETAVPYSAVLFYEYVTTASQNVILSDIDSREALDEQEVEALDDLQAAQDRRGTNVTVNQAESPTLTEGDIDLTFGVVVTFGLQIPNREAWDAAVADFVANNPQVANISLKRLTPLSGDIQLPDFAEEVDCYYQNNRIDPNEDISLLVPLDALIASDPNLGPDDLAGNALNTLQINGQTYGMPLHLQPEVLYYNRDLVAASGAFEPYQGWSVGDFEQTLRTLRFDEADPAPFEARTFGGTYLLTLVAAYGGLPMDFSTQPATLDFTSDINVNAIRQVLDLARDGYIDYSALAAGGGFGPPPEFGENPALYAELLSDLFNFGDDDDEEQASSDDLYRLVTFPQGTEYVAVAYNVGGAYITSSTDHIEACYAFLTSLTEQPDLFSGMPARRSLINSDAIQQAQGEDAVAFFNELDTLLQQPNVVELPSAAITQLSQVGDFLSTFWLFRTFDRYVQDDADLLAELKDAEQYTHDFQECVAQIPPLEQSAGIQSLQGYVTQFAQCSVNVDPSTRDNFGGLGVE